MRLSSVRPNVLALTLTSQELAALFGAARMALDTLREDPRAPGAAVALLERITRDYDRALERLGDDGGRCEAPAVASQRAQPQAGTSASRRTCSTTRSTSLVKRP